MPDLRKYFHWDKTSLRDECMRLATELEEAEKQLVKLKGKVKLERPFKSEDLALLRFPVQDPNMWSGAEVQQWLDNQLVRMQMQE